MGKLIRKKRVIPAVVILMLLFTFVFNAENAMAGISTDACGFSVSAAEADSTDAVTDDSAGNQTSDAASGDTQSNASPEVTQKSESTFFKWAIPITCILSLALAVFLAIRKANKKFGDDWE